MRFPGGLERAVDARDIGADDRRGRSGFMAEGEGGAPSLDFMKSTNSLNNIVAVSSGLAASQLRRCGGCGECADDTALRQLDFESVFARRTRIFERFFCCATEGGGAYGLALERMFGFERAPGSRAHAAERDAGLLDLIAVQLQHDSRPKREQTHRRRGRAT